MDSTLTTTVPAPSPQVDALGLDATGPSRNALRHGLTASIALPAVLRGQRLPELHQQFSGEFTPRGPTESLLMRELTRHAAMLEVAEQAEQATLRHGAGQLAGLGLPLDADSEQALDAALAAAVSNDSIERLTRYRRGHERGYYTALNKILEIQKSRQASARTTGLPQPADQPTEQSCEDLLRRRFGEADWKCPRCGRSSGYWLPARRCWQCAHCDRLGSATQK